MHGANPVMLNFQRLCQSAIFCLLWDPISAHSKSDDFPREMKNMSFENLTQNLRVRVKYERLAET